MITTIQPTAYNPYISQNRQSQPSFCGGLSLASHKGMKSTGIGFRKVLNFVSGIVNRKRNNELYEALADIDSSSPYYIDQIARVSSRYLPRREVEINIETGRLEEIAKDGTPHIFIMNHSSQTKDPSMLALFNMMLCDEYMRTGQAATCPHPKIVLNEDIMLAMNKKNRTVFEKIGAVPIDASLVGADKRKNTAAFLSLIKGFEKGKANIFIFPEGKLAPYKCPLENKFRKGVAEIVTKLVQRMPEVKVTPLGFAYGKGIGHCGDSIYIGKTITFRKAGEGISATSANADSSFASSAIKEFFCGEKEAVLEEKGVPVKARDAAPYVGGIMCENINICSEEAEVLLPKKVIGPIFNV